MNVCLMRCTPFDLRELLLHGFLQGCIPCAERFVGFEHVPEPQVVAPPGSSWLRCADDASGRQGLILSRRGTPHRCPHRLDPDSQGHRAAADTGESPSRRPPPRQYPESVSHRGRALQCYPHVGCLPQGVRCACEGHAVLLEQVVPVCMVSNNLYSISFQAEHISSPKSNAWA